MRAITRPRPPCSRERHALRSSTVADSHVKQHRDEPPRSRGVIRPSYIRQFDPPEIEGAGKTGCRLAPAAPVREKMHGAGTTGSAETTRPSLRDGVTAYTYSPRGSAVLPPFATMRAPRIAQASAPGCQDHTISPSSQNCSSAREMRAAIPTRHRIFDPTFVTIAKRPSYRVETAGSIRVICPTRQVAPPATS